MSFTSLHCHTEYSNLRLIDCINPTDSIIQEAYDKGYKGVAITDHECLSAHIKALQKGKSIREKFNSDFKVLLGNEIYLTETRDRNQQYYHFLLIAKDLIGHRQLRELSSNAWKNSYYDRRLERVPTLKSEIESIIGNNKGHIIASTACLGGEFAQSVLQYLQQPNMPNKSDIHAFVTWCKDMFGEDFYIELQTGTSSEQIAYNEMAVKVAKGYKIKTIVTNDVHYTNKEDRTVHKAYLNSKDEERETADFYASTYMHTEEEMLDSLNYLDSEDAKMCISNTMEIWDKCENIDLFQPTSIPELAIDSAEPLHIFKEWYSEYKYIDNFASSSSVQDKYFIRSIENGFIAKKQEFNEINLNRINTELEELWKISAAMQQKLSAYYNLGQKIVDIMWDDELGNSFVGVARGSVTGMYTCYLTGITQLNPIPYGLYSWRHIHSSRPELPKIHWAYKVNI